MSTLTRRSRGARAALTVVLLGSLLSGCGIRDLVDGKDATTPVAAPSPTPQQTPSMPPVASTSPPVNDPSLQAIPSLDGVTPTPDAPMKPKLTAGYRYVKDWRTGLTFAIRKDVQTANPATVAKTGKAPSNWRELARGQKMTLKQFADKVPARFGLGNAHYVSNREYWMLSYATIKEKGPLRINDLTKSNLKSRWTTGGSTVTAIAEVETPMGEAFVVARRVKVERPIGLKYHEERTLVLPYGDNEVAMIALSDSSKDLVNKPMNAIIASIHQK